MNHSTAALHACIPSLPTCCLPGFPWSRNVTDDPELRLKLRPVTVPKERYPMCLHLKEGTRVCAVRADDAWSMTRDVLPTLRTLGGGNMSRDIMVWNFG